MNWERMEGKWKQLTGKGTVNLSWRRLAELRRAVRVGCVLCGRWVHDLPCACGSLGEREKCTIPRSCSNPYSEQRRLRGLRPGPAARLDAVLEIAESSQ